jgi:glutamate decarboxylase
MPTFALNFSRPGGEVICQYYNFLRLGREGYREVHQACHRISRFTWPTRSQDSGRSKLFTTVRVACRRSAGRSRTACKPGFSLYDFADRLRTRGWQVPAYSMPPNRSDLVVQRILVRHGFSRDLAELLLEDFCRTLEYFKQHPAATPMAEHESGGHNHTGRFKKKHA